MMQHLEHLPYFLGETGPSGIHGVGNYVLQVKSYDPYVLSLHFIFDVTPTLYSVS